MASAPAVAMATGTRSAWWQWLLLAVLLLLLLALLAWLVRPYLPHSSRASKPKHATVRWAFAVRQPVEMQQARVETLQQENENLRLGARPPHRRGVAPRRQLCGRRHRPRRRGRGLATPAPIERGAGPTCRRPDVNVAGKDPGKDKDAKADAGQGAGR